MDVDLNYSRTVAHICQRISVDSRVHQHVVAELTHEYQMFGEDAVPQCCREGYWPGTDGIGQHDGVEYDQYVVSYAHKVCRLLEWALGRLEFDFSLSDPKFTSDPDIVEGMEIDHYLFNLLGLDTVIYMYSWDKAMEAMGDGVKPHKALETSRYWAHFTLTWRSVIYGVMVAFSDLDDESGPRYECKLRTDV